MANTETSQQIDPTDPPDVSGPATGIANADAKKARSRNAGMRTVLRLHP
jgi:hypothetical protein